MKLSFVENKECRDCSLHKTCQSVCVPGRLMFKASRRYFKGGSDTAVLFVGEAPGPTEDEQNQCFVGPSGHKLGSFHVAGAQLRKFADIYASNAVRCMPPKKPTTGQIKACRQYIEHDIKMLAVNYRRVLIIATGSYATQSLVGRNVTEQLAHQGEHLKEFGNVYLIATWHPAFLLREPKREKEAVQHMIMAHEWLAQGSISTEEMPTPEAAPPCTIPADDSEYTPVCVDIETWGCLKIGQDQRTFHPVRAWFKDGVPRHSMIVTAHISWRDSNGDIHVGSFDFKNRVHRERLQTWMDRAGEIWGQNLQFDLKFLRYCGIRIPRWKRLRDLMVETFVYDDLSPRKLKAVALLYRVASYDKELKPTKVYRNEYDPKLIKYGCKDAWAEYRCIEIAEHWMVEKFGDHPQAKLKTTQRRLDWFSDQIWTAIIMEERGIVLDHDKLVKLDRQHQGIMDRAVAKGQRKYGKTFSGKGSQSAILSVFKEAVEICNEISWDRDNPRQLRDHAANVIANLNTTDGGELSCDAANRNALLGIVPSTSPVGRQLSIIAEIAGSKKIVTSYTSAMLFGTSKKVKKRFRIVKSKTKTAKREYRMASFGEYLTFNNAESAIRLTPQPSMPNLAIVFPHWFIIPKGDDKGGKAGGVSQYRWSAKGPAVQTFPSLVKECLTTRFDDGVLFMRDYGQIEWRMAAYTSNDRVMLQELEDKIDPHLRTAGIMMQMDLTDHRYYAKWLMRKGGLSHLVRCPDPKMRMKARKFAANPSRYHPSDKSFHPRLQKFIKESIAWYRQNNGKSQNFAYIYGGMPPIIQATCRVKAGWEADYGVCEEMVRFHDNKYRGLRRYRRQLIDEALQYHAIHLDILGLSRSFGGGEREITGQYRGQIYDFPIQCHSGLLLQSALTTATKIMEEEELQSYIIANVHDAGICDSRASDADRAREILHDCMHDNWYLTKLEQTFDRPFPIVSDEEILVERRLGLAA